MTPQDVEHFAKAHSRVRDFAQEIRLEEWQDLTMFPLLSIRASETWELALAREFADPPGPQIGLRSKSLFRLVYADPHFFRADVMHEWPAPRTTGIPAETVVPQAVRPPAKSSAGYRRGQRLSYIGRLETFMARFGDELLARITDNGITQQFEEYCAREKEAGKPVPNLPRDSRNIERQVAKIRARRLAKTSIRPA